MSTDLIVRPNRQTTLVTPADTLELVIPADTSATPSWASPQPGSFGKEVVVYSKEEEQSPAQHARKRQFVATIAGHIYAAVGLVFAAASAYIISSMLLGFAHLHANLLQKTYTHLGVELPWSISLLENVVACATFAALAIVFTIIGLWSCDATDLWAALTVKLLIFNLAAWIIYIFGSMILEVPWIKVITGLVEIIF